MKRSIKQLALALIATVAVLCVVSTADAGCIFGRIGARIAARQEARQSARANAGCAKSGGRAVGLLRVILPPYRR